MQYSWASVGVGQQHFDITNYRQYITAKPALHINVPIWSIMVADCHLIRYAIKTDSIKWDHKVCNDNEVQIRIIILLLLMDQVIM